MAKGYVPIFFDWIETTQDLTAEEKGNLIDAVVLYACGKEYEHLLSGACRIAFRFMQGQVDRNAKISKLRQEARLGKKQDNTEQNTTNGNKPEQTETSLPNNNNNKNKNNNKNNIEPPRRFTPPTVEQVQAYCKERGNAVDPQRFVDFYTAKGWKVGNQAMKDWKAAVRTWEGKDSAKTTPQRRITAQQYEQRDYSEPAETMEEVLTRLQREGMA